MTVTMKRQELEQLLPHREDMLLLDEAEVVDGCAHGKKYIRGDEFFLRGHFPGDPIVPGVILCEILAQSVCVLLQNGMPAGATPMYTGLNNVRFKSPVRPGDTFETRCRITRAKKPFYFAEGSGYVGDTLCIKAEFSFALVEQ